MIIRSLILTFLLRSFQVTANIKIQYPMAGIVNVFLIKTAKLLMRLWDRLGKPVESPSREPCLLEYS